MSRTLHKFIRQTREEKITFQHRLDLHQPLLRQFKIEIHVQRGDKLGDGIGVLVGFLFDDADELTDLFLVLIRVSFAEVGGYDRGGDVAEDPGAGGLNGVYVGGGKEELTE